MTKARPPLYWNWRFCCFIQLSSLFVILLANTAIGEETVTIPISSYHDLLNRMESLEQRVTSTEINASRASSPTSDGTSPQEGGMYGKYEFVFVKRFTAMRPRFMPTTRRLAPWNQQP